MSVNTCLETVIGLVRKEDDCIDGYDASYSISDSGIYMNEIPGMNLRVINSLGGATDIWEKMTRARENAINTFKTDIFSELFKFNEVNRKNTPADIGYRRFTTLLTKYAYHGLRMYSDINGGTFTLRAVTLNLNSTETVDLLIYDDFELIETIADLNSSANKPYLNTLASPIELPLNGNYYFIYAPTGTPYNNKMTCGCGGYRWCFNIEKPCLKPSRDEWTNWAMIGGIHGSDVADRDDWTISGFSQGLRLHGDFKCDATGIICQDGSDFQNDQVDRAIAFAIAYKADEFLAYEIINSEDVNRYTLMGKDPLVESMKYYSERYVAMINFIAENIPVNRNDCLRCRRRLIGHKHII